jgi:thiamine-monophosphate kinase
VSRRPFGVTALGPGREFDRIRQIARALGRRAVELGNDCALIPAGAGTLALSTDTSVEGVHFRLDWLTLAEVGWRAAAAALSDLAAAGVEPAGLLAAAVVPPSAGDEDLVALMGGVGAAGASVGASVVGGDLSSGPLWMVTITVLGRGAAPLTRVGARPGDRVWVTGRLGAARAALEAWRRGAAPSAEARIAFAHPQPRIAGGRWLAEHGAHAMMDLSDGLAGDAPHLAAASEVSLELELESLPVAQAAIEEAGRLQVPVQQFAAEGGEDYELLAALPFEFGPSQALDFERACGIALTRIGSVEPGNGVRVRLAGQPLTLRGYDHFS